MENICCSVLVDLYCQLTKPHFMGKDSQLSEKPRNFSPSNVFHYTVYTTFTLLAIYSYSYYIASYSHKATLAAGTQAADKYAPTCLHFLPISPIYNKKSKSPNSSISYLLYTKCFNVDCCAQLIHCVLKNF